MLTIISHNTTIADRYKLNIYKDNHTSTGNSGCFVLAKNARISVESISAKGCFALYTNSPFTVNGDVVVIEMPGVSFPRTTLSEIDYGNPGDLSYIDGCSNSIIIPPPRNGEPCVNYLYFPPGIMQTQHTHPSLRLGYVLSGKGKAHLPNTVIDLVEGTMFLLDRHTLHNFSTDAYSSMSLVVFHPDSDSGPTDEFNPMKTRTYIQK